MGGAGHAFPDLNPNQYIYRARKFGDASKPMNVAQLSYPPPTLVISDQRVNRAGTSVFYCCAIPEATYYELNAKEGDRVVLSKWQFARPPRVNHIGFTPSAFNELGSRRAPPDFNVGIAHIEHPMIQRDRNKLVEEFLAEVFTVPVVSGQNDHSYKLSIAISEISLTGPGFDGLLYPTVAMSANADNLALVPQYVDTHVRFVSADYLVVTHHAPSGTQTELLDQCVFSSIGGNLEWSGYSPKWYYGGFTSGTVSGTKPR